MGGVSEPDGMPVDCVPHADAVAADVERVKRDLGGYRCGVRVEADGQSDEKGREGGAKGNGRHVEPAKFSNDSTDEHGGFHV